jgi:hypothetical protein
MSASLHVRRRPHKRREPFDLEAFFASPATAGAGGIAADGPSLLPPEPEGARSTLVSGSLSLLLHGAIMGALILAAALAPVDEIIPVTILREKPGSKEEPAPAPRRVVPRRAVARTAAPQVVQQVTAQPVVAQPVTAQVVQMAQVNQSAPTDIARQQTVAKTVTAKTQTQTPTKVQMNYSQTGPTAVRVAGLQAPQAAYAGPQVVEARAPVAVSQEFVNYAANAQQVYDQQTELSAEQMDMDAMGIEIETAVADSLLEGQGTGGNGKAIGTVPCKNSAPVHRYYSFIKERTLARWDVPPGTPSGEEVKLRFELDSSGSATKVEFIHATNDALGDSAVRALRESSPFPAMNDAVRGCLADTPLRAKFSVPSA